MLDDRILNAPRKLRGNCYDDFTEGQVFDHHWGRTVEAADNVLFNSATIHYNPLYFNAETAKADGHKGVVTNPFLAFSVVFGLSVEDLSERGGAFLGIDDLEFYAPVYPGDTLTARSTVMKMRESKSDASYGIVTWKTQGFNQSGEQVLQYLRTNLVIRQAAEAV